MQTYSVFFTVLPHPRGGLILETLVRGHDYLSPALTGYSNDAELLRAFAEAGISLGHPGEFVSRPVHHREYLLTGDQLKGLGIFVTELPDSEAR